MVREKIEIYHLIDTLSHGGAETMLLRLLKQDRWKNISHTVCYMGRSEDLKSKFLHENIDIVNFGDIPTKNPTVLWDIFNHFRKANVDILHNHLPDSQIVGRILGRIAGLDIIISTHHNVCDNYDYRSRKLEYLTRRLDSSEIAVSKAVKKSLAKNNDPTWHVIPNSIDMTGFSKLVSQANTDQLQSKYKINQGITFLNIGRYTEQKNQELLISSMKNVHKTLPEAKLLIVGWGDKREELEEKIQSAGLEDCVFLTGKVPEVYPYYAAADVFVLSSIREGFGIVLLEAMAANLPIISTATSGPQEVIGDSGIIVPTNRPKKLSAAMLNMDDSSVRERYSEQAQERSKQYDINNAINQHTKIYNELASSNNKV